MELRELLNRYETLMARKDEIEAELKEIREEIKRNLSEGEVIKVTSDFGTTWAIRKQVRRRETVNKELLKLELGKLAEKFITVKEYPVLDIRPSRKAIKTLILAKVS